MNSTIWTIKPHLWVAKFIAHEVEISMTTNSKCNQSDHLYWDKIKLIKIYVSNERMNQLDIKSLYNL